MPTAPSPSPSIGEREPHKLPRLTGVDAGADSDAGVDADVDVDAGKILRFDWPVWYSMFRGPRLRYT